MQHFVPSVFIALGLVACGGAAPPPPAPVTIPEPAPVDEATMEPEVSAGIEPEKPSAEAPPVEMPAPVEERIELIKTTSAGRPMVQYVEASGITTTLGHNGGILKIGEATLRIPDGALREGLNVTFAVAPKVKGPQKAMGQVYKVGPKVHSAGRKFQIALPIPQGAGPLGFAVELQGRDEKTGKPKLEWQSVAPTKVFLDTEPAIALLELEGLFDGHVTLVEESEKPGGD